MILDVNWFLLLDLFLNLCMFELSLECVTVTNPHHYARSH